MNPVIVQWGPFTIRWYGLMMATMILAAASMAYRFGPRFGAPKAFLEAITVPFVIVAFVAARLGYVLSHLSEFANPVEVLRIDHGGLTSHGAIAAGLLFLWISGWRAGISLWDLADALCWVIPLGNIFVRFGNFMNGELYGDITTVPWAIRFPGVPGHRHPLQLYEMVLAGGILVLALWLAPRRRISGQLFWTVMVLTSVGRILFDLFRSADRVWGILTLGQIPAITLVIVGAWFLLRRPPSQPARTPPTALQP